MKPIGYYRKPIMYGGLWKPPVYGEAPYYDIRFKYLEMIKRHSLQIKVDSSVWINVNAKDLI